MSFRVPFIRPVFPSAEEMSSDFASIVDSNWYTNFGPFERRFSAALGNYIGDGYSAVTFANATIALIAAIHVGVGSGDGTRQILVPSFTFAAGPQAIEWCRYVPHFIDVDATTLQPSIGDARAALSRRDHNIAAILLCNTFGIGNRELADWEELAKRAGLPLLIDSAAGFGSLYPDGSPVGSKGDAEIFSFHATKPFAIGEGGAVVTRDADLAARLAEFTNFGFHGDLGAVALGLNGKLTELSAATGLRQLATLEPNLESRRQVVRSYRELLPDRIQFPTGIESSSVCFATMLLENKEARDRARTRLVERGVEARSYYSPPVHRQPHFAQVESVGSLEVTDQVADRVLSVPAYAYMDDEDVRLVVETLQEG